MVTESLASILLNSSNLLRIDLDGVNVLAPSIVSALEAVLPEKEVLSKNSTFLMQTCLFYVQFAVNVILVGEVDR